MSISSLHRRSLGRFSSKALFQISLIIQRSPIIQIEKTAFEKAYQKYFYEVEKELSRGPFKLSLGLLSEADSKTASTLQSNEPGQLSLEDADNAATSLIEQANSLPITDPNRNPSEKLFLVIKRPLFEFWEFPTIEYVDGSFETPLHKVATDHAKTLFSGAEPNFYVPGNAPFDFQQTANKTFYFRIETLLPFPPITVGSDYIAYAWLSKRELQNLLSKEIPLGNVLSCLVD